MKEKKKRTILNRLWSFVFLLVALVFLGASAVCAVSPVINPNRFVWASFFGLAFWPIFIVDVLLLIVMAFLRAKSFVVPLLALIICIPGFKRSYSVGNKLEGTGDIKVLSYNVEMFREREKNRSIKNMTYDIVYDIASLIRDRQPDIVCIQEFATYDYRLGMEKCIDEFCEKIGMKYSCYNSHENFAGNVIFSRYPIVDIPTETGSDEMFLGVIRKIDAGSRGEFYLANVHMTSYQMTVSELNYVTDTKNLVENSDIYGKSIVGKLKNAYIKRTKDSDQLLQRLPADGLPVVVCGDFNDTPLSYTYGRLKRYGLNDGFIQAGHGAGSTYAGKMPLLRIDYVWSNNQVVPMTFERINEKYSDHYPVVMTFNILN